MKKKRLAIIFNKCDLANKKEIEQLQKKYPEAFFVTGTKKKTLQPLQKYLENLAENYNRPSLRIGFVGYPNVGKSTLINIIAPEAKAKVSNISGTTKKTQWIRKGKLRIIDSPGVIPYGDKNIQVGITASKDPHKIKNPETVALRLIEHSRKKRNFIEKHYKVQDKNDYELFLKIGKKKGYLKKGGEIDEHRTAINIIEQWQKGKITTK